MNKAITLTPIATIKSDFPKKFGIPRQSGLVNDLISNIVFEEEYRNRESLRGLEEFSHIWLIWGFSANPPLSWSPTVRPPRLGGNIRKGVFATRSPFRPNPIGISSVELVSIALDVPDGPLIQIKGADLMDGTPIYDIKPYIYSDCHINAIDGFAGEARKHILSVSFPNELLNKIPSSKRKALTSVLSLDPRPSYHNNPERIYGFIFAGFEVKFKVEDNELIVVDLIHLCQKK